MHGTKSPWIIRLETLGWDSMYLYVGNGVSKYGAHARAAKSTRLKYTEMIVLLYRSIDSKDSGAPGDGCKWAKEKGEYLWITPGLLHYK